MSVEPIIWTEEDEKNLNQLQVKRLDAVMYEQRIKRIRLLRRVADMIEHGADIFVSFEHRERAGQVGVNITLMRDEFSQAIKE